MALKREELLALMKAAAQANNTTNYNFNGQSLTNEALNTALREELKEYSDFNKYRKDKIELFELMEETLNFIIPKKVENAYAQFAETKTYAQGQRPVFRVRGLGKQRAKQFITRVGLAGRYEVFKLGDTEFEVTTSAVGGAALIGYEEFLDGRVDFFELIQIVLDSMDELVYREIAKSLIGAIDSLPQANRATHNGFDAKLMDRLITVASAYGAPTIYCTREFAVNMIPEDNYLSDNIKDALWNEGYLGRFHGVPVVVLPQSFEDETNSRKIIDPGYAWVIPSDGNTKPVKVAFEGFLHMDETKGYDWSREINFYQKVGVSVIMTNNIAVYKDESLAGKLNTIGA